MTNKKMNSHQPSHSSTTSTSQQVFLSTMKDSLLKERLKKIDQVELPMDENFFDQMHEKIMQSVEKTEIKQLNRWAKTWVFLETKARYLGAATQTSVAKKAKPIFMVVALLTAYGLCSVSFSMFEKFQQNQIAKEKLINQERILKQAELSPNDWSELAAVSQSESDLYAEILNEKLNRKINQHSADVLTENIQEL